MPDESAGIYAALVAAQAAMPLVAKGGENKFHHYRYAQLEDYIQAAQKVLADNGLGVLVRDVIVDAQPDRTTKGSGVERAVRVRLKMELVHTSGAGIPFDAVGEGQDVADKAVYKAITGARKYALACILNAATSDDPEQDAPVGENATPTATPPQPKASDEPVSGVEAYRKRCAELILEMAGGDKAAAGKLCEEITGFANPRDIIDVSAAYDEVYKRHAAWTAAKGA